jgi:Coproporphyrinogen III oxidase and related Fe-S oxidoreductases
MPQGFVQNAVPTRDYLARIAEDRLATAKGYVFTREDRFRADIIERIMCDLAVDLPRVSRLHGRDLDPRSSIGRGSRASSPTAP